ncbi:MAG: 4-hydroxy-tetrahydrodipicolinate synthase [Firmicutes bacterium]|nr:4-hydroxy-tetrahydrodipicolinate synthase [Bacillota bacterium]
MSLEIKGVIPAIVTPLDQRDQVNEAALRKLVNYLIDGGVHGLFPVGSQGEFYALTTEEKKRVIETVVDETRGRVPVYAGTGAVTTREAVELTRVAESAGADAVSVITPYFVSPSQSELVEHFTTIAKATKIPVLLYNNPARTGCNITAQTVETLSKVENIRGIKDSSGDMTLTAEYIRRTPETFSVLMGRDTLIYAALCHGAKGSITATANVAPRLVSTIYDAFMAGDRKTALDAQYKLAPLRLAFGLGTFPVVIKEALNMIGIEAGYARAPVGPMAEDKKAELRTVLTDMGLLG